MDYGLDYEGDMGGGDYSGGGGSRTPSAGGSSQRGGGGSASRKRTSYDEQTIRAVTVNMMTKCSSPQMGDGNGLQLPDGRSLYHVQFVAAVRSLEDNSTHIMYHMEDGTGGVINVKQWLDDSSECTGVVELRRACSKEHVYLKVVGQLKDYDGQKLVLADSIRPLTTANQITHHFLQVVYQAEMHKQGKHGSGAFPQPQSSSVMGFSGTPVASRGPLNSSGDNGDTALRREVLHAFTQHDMGNSINNVIDLLTSKFPEEAIRNEITYLSNEGKLYSTIDEDHLGVA
ncbi:hypothetical protein ACA910_001755 [Epithemia clementina (nom. ined.)]